MTDAPPTESRSDSENSAALRRLLGALGDTQRPQSEPAPQQAALPSQPVAITPTLAVPAVATAAPTPAPTPAAVADLHPIAVGPLPAGFALPSRPAMVAVPALALPASFCSGDTRNQFHDGTYVPAIDAAKRNNDAAIGYMRQLQDLYDRYQLSGDINPLNAVAAESRAYSSVAAAAFAEQSALVGAFKALMAVPITPCDVPK